MILNLLRNISLLLIITSYSVFGQNSGDSDKSGSTYLANQLLENYVIDNLVDYSNVKKESSKLQMVINSINGLYTTQINNNQKAILINTYNLLVIKIVSDHYPVTSPMEIPGFFDDFKVRINRKDYSLNDIENELLRKAYKDPRIHFALVCGAISCPPIMNFAYKGEKLEKQLNEVTKRAINDTNFVKTKNGLEISEIFKWYVEDFENSNKGIKSFISKYHDNPKVIEGAISYYTYNWALNDFKKNKSNEVSNVAAYTPSVLLKKGQIELQAFNNLYTQTAWRDENGIKQSINGRGSWNTLTMTFNYGISKSGRFNLGMDVNLRSTSNGAIDSKAIDIFGFKNDNENRTTISTIGPKIKLNLFKKIPKLSVQSVFLIPIASNLEGTPWLDWQRYTWWTQFFYDKPIGTKFQLFTEIDALIRVRTDLDNSNNDVFKIWTPASVFLSWFPTKKSTIYGQFQYAPELSNFPAFYMQGGLGGKYQLFKSLQLEISYTNFFAGISNGAGSTFNLGLRYIR